MPRRSGVFVVLRGPVASSAGNRASVMHAAWYSSSFRAMLAELSGNRCPVRTVLNALSKTPEGGRPDQGRPPSITSGPAVCSALLAWERDLQRRLDRRLAGRLDGHGGRDLQRLLDLRQRAPR